MRYFSLSSIGKADGTVVVKLVFHSYHQAACATIQVKNPGRIPSEIRKFVNHTTFWKYQMLVDPTDKQHKVPNEIKKILAQVSTNHTARQMFVEQRKRDAMH